MSEPNKPASLTVQDSPDLDCHDPDKPFGVPVEGCPVCEALYKGDIRAIHSQSHENVMKHITEDHTCQPPDRINGVYYLQCIMVTVITAAFRRGKYVKRYLTAEAFWEKELNKFEVFYTDEKSALVLPKDILTISIVMDED